jgi:hypothetical protein
MKTTKEIFHRGWITAGHSSLWNCDSTYCAIPYENLPSIDMASDDLEWLDCVSLELRQVIDLTSTLNSDNNQIGNLEVLVEKASRLGLHIPNSFLKFFRNAELQCKVPTCTDCYLELSNEMIPVPKKEGHFLLRFMNDSQSCVLWYLCMGQNGESWVVASSYYFDPDIFEVMNYVDVKRDDIIGEALFCAETFTEFLYRFWIENTIWYSLHYELAFTPIQQKYQSQIQQKL